MKTVIAVSRSVTDPHIVDAAMRKYKSLPTVVLCTRPPGRSGLTLGALWAQAHGIPFEVFYANTPPRTSAGHRRNAAMVDSAEALVAVWDGKSPDTEDMIKQAMKRMLLRVFIWRTDLESEMQPLIKVPLPDHIRDVIARAKATQ